MTTPAGNDPQASHGNGHQRHDEHRGGEPPAMTRPRRTVAVASYLINALTQVTSALKSVRPLSRFYLLLGDEPLQHRLRAGGALSVLAAAVALGAVGGIVFARRDLA
jgi:hypothetical protein